MRYLLLLAAAFVLAACNRPTKAEQPDSRTAPTAGRIETIWEVQDKASGERLGFVERYRYDNGRMIYWVKSKSRRVKRGYITPNNNAYRYVWVAGQRTEKVDFLGADTISANARRILGHPDPVKLAESSLEALAQELRPQAPKPEPTEGAGEEE